MKKKLPKHFLYMEFDDGTAMKVPLTDILNALGKPMPKGISLGMERDGIEMHASVQPKEAEYPGFMIDASTTAAGEIYLGNFELPNETYPSRIGARLYAGCGKYETGEPIVLVTHEVTNDEVVMRRTETYPAPADAMRKLVYVDEREAKSAPWTGVGEDELPEHVEDEA